MPRLGGARRLNTTTLKGEFIPTASIKEGRPGLLDTYKFKLENGDKGYAVLTRSMNFKLYTRGRRLLGRYKFGCHDTMYDYSAKITKDNRFGLKYYNRREIGLTNYAFYRAVRRTDPIISIGIQHDRNLVPPKNKRYLAKLHVSDYIISDIKVDFGYEDQFNIDFGSLYINADQEHDDYPYWSFLGGNYNTGYNCNRGIHSRIIWGISLSDV